MAEPCGCKIDHTAVNRNLRLPKGHLISYCPMHAAAGDMLAALEKAAPVLCGLVIEKGLEPGALGYQAGGWVAKEAVCKALAAAKKDGV